MPSTVTVEETGDVKLWQLHMPLDVTFEITEMAPTGLVSRVVAGDLRALTSRYVLTPVGNRMRLEYTGELGCSARSSGLPSRRMSPAASRRSPTRSSAEALPAATNPVPGCR